MLADFDRAGGIERVLRTAECSAGSDLWDANDFSNLTGRRMHLYFSAQRVFLDDGRPAIVETAAILPDDEAYRPLAIRMA